MGYPNKIPDLKKMLKKIPQNQLISKPVIKQVENYEKNHKSDGRMKFRESRAVLTLHNESRDHVDDFHKLVHDFNQLFEQKFEKTEKEKYTLISGITGKVTDIVWQPLPPLLKSKYFSRSEVDEFCHILMNKMYYLIKEAKKILTQFKRYERWIKNALELVIRSEGELGIGRIAYELSSLQSKNTLLGDLGLIRMLIKSKENIIDFMTQNFCIFYNTYSKRNINRLKDEL